MNISKLAFLGCISTMLSLIGWSSPGIRTVPNADTSIIPIHLKGMKYLGSVDQRFQSYNVEMVEVVGGEFWRPYKTMDSLTTTPAELDFRNKKMFRKLPPVDLADKRLLNLARGLAPAYVRVSGSWANTVYFQDNDSPYAKAPAGFMNTLTRSQWKGVLDFVKATDSRLVTSFAVSKGVRDSHGVWTPGEAQKISAFTKSMGGKIAAAELFNEPTIPIAAGVDTNYGAKNFAQDVAVFKKWAKKQFPDMLLIGPGSAAEGIPGQSFENMIKQFITTDSLLSSEPRANFDVFSYHYYGAMSRRVMRTGPHSIQPEKALDSGWLGRTDAVAAYFMKLRDKYNPGKPVWVTETAEASQGGDPFAASYLDCFRYLYQLGSLAKKGVQVVMHNTLAASEYSLIDQDSHEPKPNYWAAFLWAQLMGTKVYEAGKGAPNVYLFAHDRKGHKNGITLLVLNTNKQPIAIYIPENGEQYTVTAKELQSDVVQLNGQELRLTPEDMLPAVSGKKIGAGTIELPAASISFITFEKAANEYR